jgi:peptidoglycan hydrolase CwlO-like protein
MAITVEEAEKKKTEKQLEALKGAIGILHNKINILEGRNRSLDALVRKTASDFRQLHSEVQQIKSLLHRQ